MLIPKTMMADAPQYPFRMYAITDTETWTFDNTAPGWRYFDAEGKGQVISNQFHRTRRPWSYGFPYRVLNGHLWLVDSVGHGLNGPPVLSRCSLNAAREIDSVTGVGFFRSVESREKNRRGVVRKTVNVSGDEWGAATPAAITVEVAGRSEQGNLTYQEIPGLVVLEWPVIGDDHRSRMIRSMIRNETPRNQGETHPLQVPFDFVPLPDDELRVYVLQPPQIAVWYGKMTSKRANVTIGNETFDLPSTSVDWKLERIYRTPFINLFHVVTDGDQDLFVVPNSGIYGGQMTGDKENWELGLLRSFTVDSDGNALGEFVSVVSDLDAQHTYIVVGERFLDVHNLQIAEKWIDLDQAPALVRACCLPPDIER